MADEWFGTTPAQLLYVLVSGVAILAWAIIAIRVTGLRSLSKMSSFDFVVTVAIGSVVAGIASTNASLWHGGLALTTLLGMQWVIARLRHAGGFSKVVDNQPLLLMDGPEILHDNLARARVTENDVRAKLREANVWSLNQVLGVVLETTGDVSVLHGDGPLDDRLLDDVRGRSTGSRRPGAPS